jgi:hypothetical protein
MKLNPVSLTENQSSSVITSKPAISYHFKTGQRNHAQDQMMFYWRLSKVPPIAW